MNLPVAAIDPRVFPASYMQGRQHWLAQVACVSLPKQCLAYPCAGTSPEGNALITDTVWIGSKDAKHVLVLIAGTHGIEGYAGSAIELDFLRLLAARQFDLPPDVALLVIHALTPWGYAWQRRCDADGVDLNRNAVDFSNPLPENPDYAALRSALFLDDKAERMRLFSAFEHNHGRIAFEKAVSGGQYHDPAGPFYGGTAPAHGRLVVEELIQHYDMHQRNLAVIDLHSGLGAYGYGEIICDHPPESAGTHIAQRWYGDSVTLPALGTSSSVAKSGLQDYLWHAVMNGRSCYITLEFGTYSTDQLFDVLLRDHQLWAQSDNEQARLAHSQLMRQHFCPNDPAWQEMVLFRSRQVITQALRGLSA
ncbi:conserved hypothetical protein [Crenothrix polyspora]|uniref:DUF2817 domain-containing protein n=1 Tax=Crenothrix polyspora TaxID=360316 RepID=A0A1R4H8K7_9GAMM|nr:DUF2817 domain-containing protein [Crenothrix polyspora]SJM92549.1 conserved hypothetical protein [Crenothrix polyspora]